MKKLLGVLAGVFLMVFCCQMTAFAAESKTVVALGADLTPEQQDKVLELMGLTRDQLADCEVIYITNEQEHQYLDAYIDPAVIGTRSLTSVKMTPAGKGEGILVTTQNVNYCTTGMYRNALLTAGVEDMQVFVAAPTPISGTAGLIGAIKAYEAIGNTKVSEDALDTALDELITTGEISSAAKDADAESVEALMAWLKEKIATGELDTGDENSIRKAIEEGEDKFGVHLSSDEIKKIVDLSKRLDSLGLNGSYLISQAEKLYQKYGMDIVNHTGEAINEAVNEAAEHAAKSFFNSLVDSFTGFFKGLFHK